MTSPIVSIPKTAENKAAFLKTGKQEEGFKGVLALAPNTSNGGPELGNRLHYITQAHHSSLCGVAHTGLMMKDPMTGKMSRTGVNIRKALQASAPNLHENGFIGGYRAYFKAAKSSKSIEVTLDKSGAYGGLVEQHPAETPYQQEWNNALVSTAHDLVGTLHAFIPNKSIVFTALEGSHMDSFVARLNEENTISLAVGPPARDSREMRCCVIS